MNRPLPKPPPRTSFDPAAAASSLTVDGIVRDINATTTRNDGGGFVHAWGRVLTKYELDQEIKQGKVPDDEYVSGEIDLLLKCRDAVAAGGTVNYGQAPSLWMRLVDLNVNQQFERDTDDDPVLVFFPQLHLLCESDRRECLDYEHYFPGDPRVFVFFNRNAGRWEGLAPVKGDRIDLVKFCISPGSVPEPAELCVGERDENCVIKEDPVPDLSCCLYDGTMIRYLPGCGYVCGADSEREDVWLYCSEISDLQGQFDGCFWAKRIDDAYEVQSCKNLPLGGVTFNFREVVETRPVYALPCCGCGCPDKEIYVELYQFSPPLQQGEPYVQLSCPAFDGIRHKLEIVDKDPVNPNTTRYTGYWCQQEEVPVILTLWDYNNPEPGGPDLVYLRHDCLSGEPVAAYFDSGDTVAGHGGCCMTSASLGSIDTNELSFLGFYDVLWNYLGTGTDREDCEPAYHSCTFCYKFEVECDTTTGNLQNFVIKKAYPPGHPIYSGSGENEIEDGTDYGSGLYAFADNITGLDANECPGRYWLAFDGILDLQTKDTILANVDVPGNPVPQDFTGQFPDPLVQWPQYYFHVFGGCCQGPFVTASESSGSCVAGDQNVVSCKCCKEPPATCDENVTGGTAECGPWVLGKITWDCGPVQE